MRRGTRPVVFTNVDHFQVVEGISVRGATEKDVLQDPDSGLRYIAKLGGRDNDLEVMTEYAIYLIGRSLGVPVAGARMARYRGRLRFLSLYFLDTGTSAELVHGMQLFRELYDEHTVQSVLRDELREQAMFSVQSVKAAFGAHYLQYGAHVEDELFAGFVSMLTHDALIGVQDRHHENWGVIVQREVGGSPPRFAPLYDSALAAVFNAYPSQRSRIASILEAYDWQRVRDELTTELVGLCSSRRTALILTCLRRRLRAIYRAIHGVTD